MRLKYPLIVLAVGLPLGALAGSVFSETDSTALAIAKGAATGLVTGGIAAGYVWWRDGAWRRWGKKIRARYEAEGVVHDGEARIGPSRALEVMFALSWATVGLASGTDGWLVVTRRRVVFQPRSFLGKSLEIPIEKIAGARRGESPIPNTISLRLHGGQEIELRVQKRDEWLANLATISGINVVR